MPPRAKSLVVSDPAASFLEEDLQVISRTSRHAHERRNGEWPSPPAPASGPATCRRVPRSRSTPGGSWP